MEPAQLSIPSYSLEALERWSQSCTISSVGCKWCSQHSGPFNTVIAPEYLSV